MTKLYLIYEEDGPANLMATLDVSKLVPMIKQYFADLHRVLDEDEAKYEPSIDQRGLQRTVLKQRRMHLQEAEVFALERFELVLASEPEEGIAALSKDWAGLHMQIVELYE